MFIGKNLDHDELQKAFAETLDSPANAAKIQAIEAVKAQQSVGKLVLSAAQRDDTPALKKLIAQNAPVNYRNPMGQTPLHIAAMWGRTQSCQLLIAAGADVNAKNDPHLGSATPLHMTAMGRGEPDVRAQAAKILVGAGANLALANVDGVLPWQMVSAEDAVAPRVSCNPHSMIS